jgi:hypothetical protein
MLTKLHGTYKLSQNPLNFVSMDQIEYFAKKYFLGFFRPKINLIKKDIYVLSDNKAKKILDVMCPVQKLLQELYKY